MLRPAPSPVKSDMEAVLLSEVLLDDDGEYPAAPVVVGAGASLLAIDDEAAPVSAAVDDALVSAGAASEVVSAATEVALGLDAAVVVASAGAAVLAQSQMAPADFWTWRPVAMPHDLTMQP